MHSFNNLFVVIIKIFKYFISKNLRLKLKYTFSEPFKSFNQLNLPLNSKIIDIGANQGFITEYFLKKKFRVYSYEPNKIIFNNLKKLKKKYNKLQSFNLAVDKKKGMRNLYLHKNNKSFKDIKDIYLFSGAASFFKDKNNIGKLKFKVKTTTISEIFKYTGKVQLVKIDIEGGEYLIYKDLLRYSNYFDYCFIETHHKKFYKRWNHAHRQMITDINNSTDKHKFNLNYI
jgi:FkbM family methyltransferase